MEKKKICAICHALTTTEDTPILTIGGFGTPRYLCDSCSSDIEIATRSHVYEEITAAMESITANMSEKGADDPVTLECVTDMLEDAATRATEIKEGTYDFSLDEVEPEDELEELPEELLESEEDRLLDEKEAEEQKKLDGFLNWVWLGVLIGAVGFVIWWLFFR